MNKVVGESAGESCIELGLVVRELPGLPKVSEELPAVDALHDDVDEAIILGLLIARSLCLDQ